MTTEKTEPTGSILEDIPAALEALARGGMIVVTDNEHRENEGDVVCAAERCTAEHINFMARHARGLICVAMEREPLHRLGLSRMNVAEPGDQYGTAFMESVDARVGVTTGISAFDRARTVQVLMDEKSSPDDLARPGHIFPLQAVAGGVLRRCGHTEGAVDLARLAGLKPAGVICEILRDDGNMARLPELVTFARQHGLPLVSIEALRRYRQHNEHLVRLEREVQLPTAYGPFTLKLFYSYLDDRHHLALVKGSPERRPSALVRIHSECLTGDVFGSLRCDCGSQLHEALRLIAEEGHGILLYMRQEGRGIGLAHKLHAYALQEEGLDTVEANIQLGFDADLRDYGSGAQILEDLGLHDIRLMTNNPGKIEGLERYGLRIVERIPLVAGATEHNRRYLDTKKKKMGHLF